MSLVPNMAGSEIFAVGKHSKSSSFDIDKNHFWASGLVENEF